MGEADGMMAGSEHQHALFQTHPDRYAAFADPHDQVL
jgi:hypothetical protein